MLLSKRGADVAAHSSLLASTFGDALATELIESAADLPPTADALVDNLRRLVDEAQLIEAGGGNKNSTLIIFGRMFYYARVRLSISL